MKINDLIKDTFKNLLDIDDDRLEKIYGFDLDDFASKCSRGDIDGVSNEDTLSSVDILYVSSKKELYKIEGKDLSKVIFYRIKGYTKVSMSDSYIYNKKNNKKERDYSYKAINMPNKIKGTSKLLKRIEDIKEYKEKDYILLINYESVSNLISKCDILEQEELNNQLMILAHEIEELKKEVSNLLKDQKGFVICDISKLIKILDEENKLKSKF